MTPKFVGVTGLPRTRSWLVIRMLSFVKGISD